MTYIFLAIWLSFTTFLNMFFVVSGSAIVNPITAVFTDPHRAIGIGYTVFFFGSIHRVWLFRKNIFHETINILYLRKMIPLSTIGAILGGLFISYLNETLLAFIIVIASIYFIYTTTYSLIKNKGTVTKHSPVRNLMVYIIALLSGFLQGSGLPGGDIRTNFLRSNLSEVSVRGVSSLIALCNFFVVSLILFFTHNFPKSDIVFLFCIIPVLFFIQYISKNILVKLPDKIAKIIALAMSIVSLGMFISKIWF